MAFQAPDAVMACREGLRRGGATPPLRQSPDNVHFLSSRDRKWSSSIGFMVLHILERRFGLVMLIWVACLVVISLGVKIGASGMVTAGHPIVPFVSFLMSMTWYVTFLTVVLGVTKKYWLERIASTKGHTS